MKKLISIALVAICYSAGAYYQTNLLVTGTLSPDATGLYKQDGIQNGVMSYARTDAVYYVAYQDGTFITTIGTNKSDNYLTGQWWKDGNVVNGVYAAEEGTSYSGTPTVAYQYLDYQLKIIGTANQWNGTTFSDLRGQWSLVDVTPSNAVPEDDADYTTYAARVVADGGTIVSKADCTNAIAYAKASNFWSNVRCWIGASYGVKTTNDLVIKLYDLSTNTVDLTQATTTASPVWAASQQNGRAGITFDGSDDIMQSAITNCGITTNGGVTLLLTVKHLSDANDKVLWGLSSTDMTGGSWRTIYYGSLVYSMAGYGADLLTSFGRSGSADVLLTAISNNNSTAIFRQTGTEYFGDVSGLANINAAAVVALGANPPEGGPRYTSMQGYEGMILNTWPDANTRNALVSFQTNKWGI